MASADWMVSVHGGHSGQFCDHAQGRLEDLLIEAEAAGMRVFGISEHAPRSDERFLYPTERNRGWDVETLVELFEAYRKEVARLADVFDGRVRVLRAFEAEVVPEDRWLEEMQGWRDGFDYVVGSVHHVGGRLIDGPLEQFEAALESAGGLEALAVAYYEAVAEMVGRLRPEVVGHLDLIRKNAARVGKIDTARVRAASERALEAVRASGAILDLNVSPLRAGWRIPYPAPRLVARAVEMGIPFCFGDDSHAPNEVGVGLAAGRDYLLQHGVHEVVWPDPGAGGRSRASL